ncbi:MAG: MoxR family ATPase [Planctomycetes bacterium]|nr:MoxR family ATPase [Planctomycetota bacterium]
MAEKVDQDSVKSVEELAAARQKILEQIRKVIIGQEQIVDELLSCLFARGNMLIIGVPGLAKTLLISTLAKILALKFKRIQFTPDLMPSDITGTDVIEEDLTTGRRKFTFVPGPLFANIILADEINRTPPKTQAALLQAMQEREVTVGNQTFKLELPFLVLATQNPIEQEGTYPLPEAQLDRFMFNSMIDYPKAEDEIRIIEETTVDVTPELEVVLSGKDILHYQSLVRKVPIARHVVEYASSLVRATRPHADSPPEFVRKLVDWGAGPRAGQYLVLGAKARAITYGRFFAATEDVRAVAVPVLRHRIIPNFTAEADGIKSENIIQRLLETIPEPRGLG